MELPEVLCKVDFPLYSVQMVSPRHILLGGGGGAAKTGVKNGFEIFEIGHDGYRCVAESVAHYRTGDYAVMNVASTGFDPVSQRTVVAVGYDERCQTLSLQLARERRPSECGPDDDDDDGGGDNVRGDQGGVSRRRNRKTSISGSAKAGSPSKSRKKPTDEEAKLNRPDVTRLVFRVAPLKSVQTDFGSPEPYQKVVRISSDGMLLATGGDDGRVRVWTFPDMNAVHEIEGHDKEVDDLEFSPDNSKLISISKDRRAIVWDVKRGKKHAELGWDPPVKYAYKRVRCGKVEGDSKRYKIFAIVNPVGASKPPSYLQRWDTKSFTLQQCVPHAGSLSALAVSDNGNFVAVGSMFDGTVEIFVAFNLQRLKRVEKAHSTFVTGLEFLPTAEESDAIRGCSDASVVSISVDHYVCIHHVPRLRKISITAAALLVCLLLVATFYVCSVLGI